MPSIGATRLFSASGAPASDGNILLYTTLAFALTSFLCSTYTTLRTLLPLLAPHALARRREGIAAGASANKRIRLKSAQRFTTYLAICDILSACILVWEAAAAATLTTGLGGTKAGASRLYLACTARPTLLLVVAVLSYANVVQGRSIALGKVDWIVWAPALGIFILGAGLASLAPVGGLAVWIGLVVWLSATTAVVSICFGRLLVAILRVRKTTANEEKAASPFAQEQNRVVGRHGSSVMQTIASYLPPFHSNFSGLSTSFISTVGRSTSTLDLPSTAANNSHNVLTFTSSSAPGVGYAPSARTSMDSDQATLRDVRSPTPGSTMGLLAGLRQSISRPFTPDGRATLSPSDRFSVGSQEHEIITFEEVDLNAEPRPSMGSYTSSNFHAGGFVGGTAMRQVIVQEVWGTSPAPGTGHRSPQVELSKKEARGALVRIGGHLFGCLLGYALVTPFAFIRLANPSSTPPLIAAILLVIGVSQPGLVLAVQCWMSEGFWYRTESPPILTSSSAANLEILVDGQPEMLERPGSAASSYYAFEKSHATLPGIQPGGEDAVETRMGRVGRALSMMHTHPKLMILPNGDGDSSSTSGAKTGSQGHARLRSLTLSKTVFGAILDDEKQGMKRSGSIASRKTFAGFEMRSMSPIPFHRDDEAITRSMLATTKQRPLSFADTGRIPFGFTQATNGANRSTPELSYKKATPAPTPSPSTPDFAFRTEDLTLANTFDATLHSKKSAPSSPPDYSIDFLSSQVLPRLVPSVVVGRSTIVESEDAPLNRRRSSIGTANELTSTGEFGLSQPSSRPTRNIRNLSLPNLLQGGTFSSRRSSKRTKTAEDVWVAVEEDTTKASSPIVERAKTPESVIASIASRVRAGVTTTASTTEDRSLRRRSWKDRSTKAWEEREKVEGVSRSARIGGEVIETTDDAAYLRPPGSAKRSSGGWGLDSPIVGDQTEILEEEGNVADQEESDDEKAERELEAHRRRRSVSPMSLPTSPVQQEWQQLDESIVLRGSQFIDEDEDGEVGTVHCATIRPVRGSDTSDVDSTSHYSLRPTHIQTGSLGSNRSLATSASGITSQGFRNVLETGSWHARDEATTGAFSSSDSELSSSANEAPPSRRSSSGLRPLSILSQRANADRTSLASSASDGSDYEREMRKVVRHQTAVQASSRAPNAHGIPLPPIPMPPTIEEVDEGKSSGTPTPRTARQRTASTPRAISTSTPLSSTPPPLPPSRTPPQITTRSRARREQHRRARDIPSAGPAPADENVQPLATTQPLRIATRSVGGGGGGAGVRGLR